MSKKFLLPDLGEGLPDATIVEWYVKVGDTIKLDENLVSMETAKAVVEVPSPFSGTVVKLYGANGDVIITGAALVDIELDPSLPQRAEAQDTGHHHGHAARAPEPALPKGAGEPTPAGTAQKVIASDEGGWTMIRAEVPSSELLRYAIELRSLTSGTGTFTRRFSRYDPLPEALAARASK